MARNRTKNIPIGTCPCPYKNCELIGELYRFRTWSDDKKVRRLGGKLYMQCPTHGRSVDQEWLLANATITNDVPADPQPDDPSEGAPADEPDPPKPADQVTPDVPESAAPEPEPKTDDSTNEPFGFF